MMTLLGLFFFNIYLFGYIESELRHKGPSLHHEGPFFIAAAGGLSRAQAP